MGSGSRCQAPLAGLHSLCLLLVAGLNSVTSDADIFLIYSEKADSCLESSGSSVRLAPSCNESFDQQQWKWVSRLRLFNLGSKQCLSIQRRNDTVPRLGMMECNQESAQMRWHCNGLGSQLSSYLIQQSKAGTQGPNTGQPDVWRIYNTDEDLCARPYHGKIEY
ncbi:hypothetical protein chiPu_0016957 [Chiloscyllium punctatum]|uniref:Ricin B lectin domain-containing protein n=1 Tax=Chiloscyllium punctatum TaxID=137246 RepID=A0A401T6Z2_CHIPU|nr:hypothetical protein [Chiloscyllium punctatum]